VSIEKVNVQRKGDYGYLEAFNLFSFIRSLYLYSRGKKPRDFTRLTQDFWVDMGQKTQWSTIRQIHNIIFS